MRRLAWLAAGAAFCTALWGWQAKDARAAVALQAAIKKEAVDGDLKGAIEQYKKIAQSRDHSVAAKALLRMGECYEKLGDGEARKAYERVVREFGDQKDSAEAARGRLAAMGKSESAESSNPRMISTGRYSHAASPDGRFLLQSGRRGEMNLLELSTGTVRQVASAPFYQPVVSPDCRQIAFMRRSGDATELRLVNADGNGERLVWTSDKGWSAGIPQWFPDGKRVFLLQWGKEGGRRMVSVSVATGNAEKLWEGKLMYSSRLSPDGKYVSFVRRLRDEPVSDQIWLLRLSDRRETLLYDGRSYMNYPDWLPDGSGVVFLSDRRQPGKSADLWFLSASEDKPLRLPMLVKTDVGEMAKGYTVVWTAGPITRDGTYYFNKPRGAQAPLPPGVQSEMTQAMKIGFDPDTGKVIGYPSFLSPQGGGWSHRTTFSHDGKRLAYVKVTPEGASSIWVQSVDTGEEESVPLSPPPKRLGALTFHPNGRSIFLTGAHPKEGEGLYEVDIQTGSWTSLKKPGEKDLRGSCLSFSADGRTLYFVRYGENDVHSITARDLESGAERVFRSGKGGCPSVSPDGKHLASLLDEGNDQVIVVYAIAGGPGREIHRFRREQFGLLLYSADGKHFLLGTHRSSPGVQSLYRIPAGGGELQPTGLEVSTMEQSIFPRGFRHIDIHPSGRQLVYAAFGGDEQGSATLALSNFLPGFKTGHK